ncbi:PTS mannose/fructose/sorbose/N-acetylgalactosamine transporter subunit IIC [Enterococcus sp. LJL120]
MELSILQIILITLLAYVKVIEWGTTQITAFNTVIYGFLTGLILGDVSTGLAVGATLQLMSLGVVAVGGASMPDYPVAAIITTTIAVTTGQGIAAGLALGLPVGMLGVQLDIIWKLFNGFITRKAMEYARRKDFGKMLRITLVSTFSMGLTAAVPVFLSITLGVSVVSQLLEFLPDWFTSGLQVAGGMLPAVGIAMLLMYMPVKKLWSYLAIGFVLSAYLGTPVLGVAIIGAALAFEFYKRVINSSGDNQQVIGVDMEDE